MLRALWAWEVAVESGWAGVVFGTRSALGSCRRIGIGRGGLGSSGGPERPYVDISETPGEVSR